VIRMVGMGFPEADRWRCKSSPVIPGICTSAIRQEVRRTWGERKNSSAEAVASARYPSDFMRPFTASRIGSSSSTIEIIGFVFGTRTPAPGLVGIMTLRDPTPLQARGNAHVFEEDKTNSNSHPIIPWYR